MSPIPPPRKEWDGVRGQYRMPPDWHPARAYMSYYIGFRHGWVRLFGRMVCWQDAELYPYLPGRHVAGSWKVWVK